jgi:hypothetical protein
MQLPGVSAVAKLHEHMQQANAPDRLDLGMYITDICRDLNQAIPLYRIEVATEVGIDMTTDRAVPIALIVNELVTNAAKHAYQSDQGGNIWVHIGRGADDIKIHRHRIYCNRPPANLIGGAKRQQALRIASNLDWRCPSGLHPPQSGAPDRLRPAQLKEHIGPKLMKIVDTAGEELGGRQRQQGGYSCRA